MGSSRSPQEFAAKMRALGESTKAKDAVSEGALAAKKIMLASAAVKGLTPSDKLAGRRWNVRFDVKGSDLKPEALVKYTGPFHLFDNPTEPHVITAKRLGRRTSRKGRKALAAVGGRGAFGGFGDRGGAKALTIGDGFAAYANHPGTKGARSFPAAKVIAEHRVPRVMAKAVKGGWLKALK